ncbi:MAG TPA: hypothetical protein PLM60_02575 [Methanoregulaceae archaeon]|nr:hypothetical protein [Methanoregulaceae archaeon]HNL86004.1 hypothetical protein [Methanoregulaceae archaeon]HNO07676.1 hypothetical protein [Methanoregulaceae archaeon]HPS22279.1 hypothetical protein [Methanoregulaceae archaeon]HQN88774.1 hypothetical protein [Methanoregulaceae archaeon]
MNETSSIRSALISAIFIMVNKRGFGLEGDRSENTSFTGRSSEIFLGTASGMVRSARCIHQKITRGECPSIPSRGSASGEEFNLPIYTK